MADGSRGDRSDLELMNDLTFSAPGTGHGDSKKCSEQTFDVVRMKLSCYAELKSSESCEKSGSSGVAADDSEALHSANSEISSKLLEKDEDDRKKRCFDRYDSSESSDSGVAVLSPSESSGSSDITEPGSPRSPESSCGATEEAAHTRMPPWASESAPAPRRLAAKPAPVRRPNLPHHRRITEFFNHKMKPQTGLKRDSSTINNDDAKKKCLPKNGVTHDLEKYISYLSQTLSPKVLLDVTKQAAAEARRPVNGINAAIDTAKATDLRKTMSSTNGNGLIDYNRFKDNKDKVHTTMNGFMEIRQGADSSTKEKPSNGHINGFLNSKPQNFDFKISTTPSANGIASYKKLTPDSTKRKIPIPASSELVGIRIAPATSLSQSPKKLSAPKPDTTRMNDVVSSTTKLDNRMNGVTCGSNNLNLNPILSKPIAKKETQKKTTQPAKRTNRKSSACIANSKNLTWSKANNLKQVQLQKQNCINSTIQTTGPKNVSGEANSSPKMNISNGVRQVPMTMNGNIGNINVPVTNFQNCHQINIPQPCNGTVSSTNLGSFVAVPQNVMLTTLRIPQNGLPAQTLTNHQPNNMNAYNRANVNVPSPTKLNGQFVFPIMQNINGAVVQIPNLMAKMPNFVLPQTSQLTAQRHDHMQNQILINGTLLKLANTMTPTFTNVNKTTMPTTSQPGMPVMNKNLTGIQTVGMTVQPKPNYTVNLSHSVLVPQPGFIVTSVPNMNVKETWSYTNTNPAPTSQTSCSNTIVHHPPPIVGNFTPTSLHTSSLPITPVKLPENPIQGTEPPSSTVKEPEGCEVKIQKFDFPWLSKTFNTNIASSDCNKKISRPFAEVSNLSSKIDDYCTDVLKKEKVIEEKTEKWIDSSMSELRKVEEVAKREDTIFTQITVLKDVSSNVQSSVIEANFCSTTTESSESGIGTDKSIDSPSDSQTSKECDDDSLLSLSISISSVEAQSCQKSPILKQPKTLRFPPRKPTKTIGDKRSSRTDTASSVTVCLWENCKQEFESDTDLLEHLQSIHVESQAGRENYVCQWERCKVRGKPSCSRLWLERHALSHGGNKPFKCIVDDCGRRFSTQILLERHVNNHFNEASPNANGGKKSTDSAPKLIRRNGKKLRYRRQPWSARMFDFFDSGIMERLAWQLSRGTRWRLGGGCPLREPAGRHTLTLHAAVAGTRYNAGAKRREALLTYYPPNVVEDEWVPEKEVVRVKRVEMSSLPAATKVLVYEQFCASYRGAGSPPPPPKPAALPPRHCSSSRLLSNLLASRPPRDGCSATNLPPSPSPPPQPHPATPRTHDDRADKHDLSGARKRKQGRRHGGNAFWPCGR